MAYGFSIDSVKADKYPNASVSCREQLQRALHVKQKQEKYLSRKNLLLTHRWGFYNLTDNVRIDWYKAAVEHFTQKIYAELAKSIKLAPDRLKMSFSKPTKQSSYTNILFRVSFPGAVLRNPQFSSFYLGIIQHIGYIATNMKEKGRYFADLSLGKFLRMLNEEYNFADGPTYNWPERKLKAFLLIYTKKGYLKEFFSKEKEDFYAQTNGFRTWYQKYGKQLVKPPKAENSEKTEKNAEIQG